MAHRAERNIGSWEAQTALGSFPDLLVFQGSGNNPIVSTTPEEIWGPGGVHTWLTTGTTLNITSENDADTQTIRVSGLDANFDFQVVQVALTGNTPAQVGAALNWTVVLSAYQVSPEPACAGDVWIAVDGAAYTLGVPNNLADVQAWIDFESANAPKVTEKMWGMAPMGHKLVIFDYSAELNTSGGTARSVEVSLEVSELALGSTTVWSPWRKIHDLTLATSGLVHSKESFKIPHVFPQCTRVRMMAVATSNSIVGAHITAMFTPTA
jgi:hypothetical protein